MVFLYIIIGISFFAKFMVWIFVEFVMLRRVDFLSLFQSLANKMTFALLFVSLKMGKIGVFLCLFCEKIRKICPCKILIISIL
jgi:hypothetical protein